MSEYDVICNGRKFCIGMEKAKYCPHKEPHTFSHEECSGGYCSVWTINNKHWTECTRIWQRVTSTGDDDELG